MQLSFILLWRQAFLESSGEGGVLYVAMGTLSTLGKPYATDLRTTAQPEHSRTDNIICFVSWR